MLIPTKRLCIDPGDAAQVDFGAGPLIVDTSTGEMRKTWIVIMTLAWSRHIYAEFIWDQSVGTWLSCHRRAFEWFNGVPKREIIGNPKCAITKACYHEPDLQRAYAECAEGYGFLISPCPVRDPQKKGRASIPAKSSDENESSVRRSYQCGWRAFKGTTPLASYSWQLIITCALLVKAIT